ncbi:hypothetical protein PT158_06985 [Erysipelothrix rhusiopathiae]|nr:hypothetical protein [Erysipelothrix rhusiopathiae]MDE8321984.1 hypothetical protein [Erysipelothrix rhusiopathiae]
MITIKTKYSSDNKSNVAYLNYIATREGVSIELSKEHLNKPVSQKQKDLLDQLFKDDAFHDDLKELKAFREKPSSYTASQLISRGLDYTLNVDNEVYLKYIATRDGAVVEPTTKHGLFDLKGTADLEAFKQFMNGSDTRVYKMIISLPYSSDFREKDKWETLIRSSHPEIAKAFKTNVFDIAWVGAVHEASNPHVHLMIWSKTDKELRLNNTEFKKSMESLKVTFAQKIYKDEFSHLNAQRQDVMHSLRSDLSKHLKSFNQGILRDGLDSNTLDLIQEYAKDIPDIKYGYQSQENKAKINSILVSLIERNPDLNNMFETLVENQSKRIDLYNISKAEDKQDHIDKFINKVFYPNKNDKPILQNILIDELQKFNPDIREKKNVVEPTTQNLNPSLTDEEKISRLAELIREKRTEHYGEQYDEIFKKDLVQTFSISSQPTTDEHLVIAEPLDKIKSDIQNNVVEPTTRDLAHQKSLLDKIENKMSDTNQSKRKTQNDNNSLKTQSTQNVVEPTTSNGQAIGLKLGKGMMRSMMQVSAEIEMTHRQAFIQSKKHQNENKRNRIAHRQEMEVK